MIYPANFEQKIGFDRLREQVAALCTMRAARGKLAEETFSASAREIGRRLELADQMRLLLDMEHDFPGVYILGQREGLVMTDITIRPQFHRIARK